MTITVDLLERIARKRRFSARTLEIAKRLFLHDETPKRLAAEYGVNLARIYHIRDQVGSAAQDEKLPPGWEEITIAAPKEVIREFRERVAQARRLLQRPDLPGAPTVSAAEDDDP
jgi:hypothetical protein